MQLLNNLDALLITNPTNVRYLTGFVGAANNEREAYVLLTQDKTFLFTNALYLEQARKLPITVIEVSREKPFAKKLGEVLSSVIPGGSTELTVEVLTRNPVQKNAGSRLGGRDDKITIRFEENDLTVAEHHKIRLEHKNVRLVPTKDRIETLRMIKREDEIENIKAAAKLTDQCFEFILGKLKPGVTDREISWKIESFIRCRGAELSFSPIVAFGKNTSQPHYSPNFTRPRLEIEAHQGEALKSRDTILLDFGAQVNGYCSDMTRVVFVGKPKDEWVRAYETVLAAQRAALEYLHLEGVKAHLPGGVRRSGATADRFSRDVIKKAGFPPYPHSLGHGVGLAIHEAPRLTIKKDVALKPGMVVTIEPAIYIERHFGIRIEDLVYLRKDRIEVLTYTPKKMLSI